MKLTKLTASAATLVCIIVTANHFWLDGVGGLAVFAVGALIGWGMHRWNQERLDRKHGITVHHDVTLASLANEIIDDVSSGDRDSKREPTDEDVSGVTQSHPEST